MTNGTLPLGLYLVTDRRLCADRGVPATVDAAIAGGVTMVQVRDPTATGRQLYELTACLAARLAGTGVPLIVDDRADIALAAGAQGVHLGHSDVPPPAVRALSGPGLIIGMSVHHSDHLTEIRAWPPGTVDYLGVGPVYPTTTKADAAPAIGTAGLAAVATASPVPCVAIGGITPQTAADVLAAGVAGLAVVSAICAATDPADAARQLRKIVEP